MRKYLILTLVCILAFSSFAQEQEKSTYYLIRHAEKDRSDKANKDPDLTIDGRQRAIRWAKIMDDFGINTIYSTNYKRTKNTAQPTSFAGNIDIKIYHPFKIDMDQFLIETKGKNVLVVGHSNTTASFANKLIGSDIYPEIEDDNNANLYIVTIVGKDISHVLIKMH